MEEIVVNFQNTLITVVELATLANIELDLAKISDSSVDETELNRLIAEIKTMMSPRFSSYLMYDEEIYGVNFNRVLKKMIVQKMLTQLGILYFAKAEVTPNLPEPIGN